MKYRKLIISTIILFLIVNTNYFWESQLGFFAIITFVLLIIFYLVLSFLLLQHFYFAISEKFSDKKRLLSIGLLIFVLISIFLKPNGLIDFDSLRGKDILVAKAEGAANCPTTFKFKENNKFVERVVCFGLIEIEGKYHIKSDTVFFENDSTSGPKDEFYMFAIIKKAPVENEKYKGDLILFRDYSDSLGHKYRITKDDRVK